MIERIDREKVKDPCEVSGWRPGAEKWDPQIYDDIARHVEHNAEFEDNGAPTKKGRADASEDFEGPPSPS